MHLPYISIIIPTFNREESLCATLASIFNQSYSNYEIILVDQSKKHSKETEDFLALNKEKIRYYRLDKPNLPNAKNFGASVAKGEILFFCDDDFILDRDCLKYHIENYTHLEIDAVVNRPIQIGNIKKPFSFFKMKDIGGVCAFSGRTFWNWDYDRKIYLQHAFIGENILSIKKEIFFRLGGFDPLFIGPAYAEDLDFGYRLKKIKAKIIFEPKALVFHLNFPSGGCRIKDPVHFEYWRFRNMMYFYLKNMPRFFLPYMLLIYFLIDIKKILIPTRSFKNFFYVLKGLWDGFKVYKKDGIKNKNSLCFPVL